MKVLYDLNVLLDVYMDRAPWVDASKQAVQLAIDDKVTGYISAISLTTLFYLTRRTVGSDKARILVGYCLSFLKVAPVDYGVLASAHAMGGDFEDCVQLASAQAAGVEAVITRDAAGFAGSSLTVLTPVDLVNAHA